MALCILISVLLPAGPLTSILAGDQNQAGVREGDGSWWETWTRDADRDRVDDELENLIRLGINDGGLTRAIVDFGSRPGRAEITALEDRGARIHYMSHYIDSIIVEIPVTERAVSGLLSVNGVVMVEAVPGTALQLDTSKDSIGIPDVWDGYGYKGTDVVVAIIDTGIDANHTGLNDLDDIEGTKDPKVVAFYDAQNDAGRIDGGTTPYDDEGHGSHVSGIVSGTGEGSFDNDSQENRYEGIAPDSRLVGVKVIDESGGGMDTAMLGIEWAMDNKGKFGIKVLSMSFGARFTLSGVTNDGNSAISRLCDEAVDTGLSVVVAAGNSGPRPYTIAPPGDARKVITVGNVYDSHGISPSSSRGPVGTPIDNYVKPDVCAPGSDVWSVEANTMDGYVALSGTSMAAPHVSGLIALMLQADPFMSPGQVKNILTQTADGNKERPFDPVPNNDYGFGVVNPMNALFEVTGGEMPPSVTITPTQYMSGLATLTGTAQSNDSEIEEVEVRIGDGGWQRASWDFDYGSWTFQFDSTSYPNGDVRVYARASDGDRYSAVASRKVTINNLLVTIDRTDGKPQHASGEFQIFGSVTGLYIERVWIEFDGSKYSVDAVSTTGDARDDYPYKTWEATVDLGTLGPGDHEYRAVADNGQYLFRSEDRSLDIPGSGNGNPFIPDDAPGGEIFSYNIPGLDIPAVYVVIIAVVIIGLFLAIRSRDGKKEERTARARPKKARVKEEAEDDDDEGTEEVVEVEVIEEDG